jgi:uncharacterized spore protein YtfJ
MDVENLLAKMADNVSVRRAFGPAYQKDGMLIIPVAIVAGGGGAGTSPARRPAARPDGPPGQSGAEDDAAPQDAAPQNSGRGDAGRSDAGGGFGALVLPSGAYVVKGDEVRWVPAVDVTIVVLAAVSLARLFTRKWNRRRRR